MYREGQGVKQDYFKATELYEKACNGGDVGGCNNLGLMYINGQGVRADKQKALNLWGKACDMKDQMACENYAKLRKQLGQ